jgi:hypothetical protein
VTERLLYSRTEAADALGICTKTFDREVRSGDMKFVRVGGARKYDINDIRDFIERRKQAWPSTEEKIHKPIGAHSSSTVVAFGDRRGSNGMVWGVDMVLAGKPFWNPMPGRGRLEPSCEKAGTKFGNEVE